MTFDIVSSLPRAFCFLNHGIKSQQLGSQTKLFRPFIIVPETISPRKFDKKAAVERNKASFSCCFSLLRRPCSLVHNFPFPRSSGDVCVLLLLPVSDCRAKWVGLNFIALLLRSCGTFGRFPKFHAPKREYRWKFKN